MVGVLSGDEYPKAGAGLAALAFPWGAAAQNAVWNATLPPRSLTGFIGTLLCCLGTGTQACSNTASLTGDDFTHAGTTYMITNLDILLTGGFFMAVPIKGHSHGRSKRAAREGLCPSKGGERRPFGQGVDARLMPPGLANSRSAPLPRFARGTGGSRRAHPRPQCLAEAMDRACGSRKQPHLRRNLRSRRPAEPVISPSYSRSRRRGARAALAALLLAGGMPGFLWAASAQPKLTVSGQAVDEGDSGTRNLPFTVTLAPASDQRVTVEVNTGSAPDDDPAVTDFSLPGGPDYQAITARTLAFEPGETEKTVNVGVNGDRTDERTERFMLHLSNAVNADIRTHSAAGYIMDDDPAPELTIQSRTLTEGDAGRRAMTFTAALSAATGREVIVYYDIVAGTATEGEDYRVPFHPRPKQMIISGKRFQTQGTFEVEILGDTLEEDDETFQVKLSAPINVILPDATITGTIRDDDRTGPITVGNTAPTASDSRVSFSDDLLSTPSYTFKTGDFNFADADSGDALASVKIVTPPSLGSLELDGAGVTANQVVTKAQLDAGNLTFQPEDNGRGDGGYASFTFRVSDGTAESADTYAMTIYVTEVFYEEVSRLMLVDAARGADLRKLIPGTTVSADRSYGVRADVKRPGLVGSVVFSLLGPSTHRYTDEQAPFSLFGDVNGVVNGRSLRAGEYSLTAAAYGERGGTGRWLGSHINRFTVEAVLPGMPRNPSARANGQTRIDLAWDAPASDGGSRVTGYRIEVSDDGSTGWSVLQANHAGTAYSHTSLTARTTKHYRISAINTTGAGTATDAVSASTLAAPKPATGLTASDPTQTTIELGWSLPGQPSGVSVTGVEAQQQGAEESWSTVATLAANATSHTVTGLTSGTAYSFRIRLATNSGNTDTDAVTASTLAETPEPVLSAPTHLGAAGGDEQVTLTWNAPQYDGQITGYEFRFCRVVTPVDCSGQRATASGEAGAWTSTDSASAHSVMYWYVNRNGKAYRFRLHNGAKYRFQVRAVATGVTGAATAWVEGIPAPAAPPPDPDATRSGAVSLGAQSPERGRQFFDGYSLDRANGDAVDYYTFTTDARYELGLGVRDQRIELAVTLENAAGETVGTAGPPADPNKDQTYIEWLKQAIDPGTYYVRVQALQDGATDYYIRFGLKDPPPDESAAPAVTGSTSFTVTEGETRVGTLTASDEDTPAEDLQWSLAGGSDESKFALSTAGALTFAAAKDYENPDDSGNDGTYNLSVRVSDGANGATADLAVTLGNRNEAPSADAGRDQSDLKGGATVSLNGSGSDPDNGDSLTYAWSQTGGTSVTLASDSEAATTFTTPSGLKSDETLTFRLRVTDEHGLSAEDDTRVTVLAAPADPDGARDGATRLDANAAARSAQHSAARGSLDTAAGDRVDYYVFTIGSQKELGLGVRDQTIDLDATLEDSSGRTVKQSWPPPAGTSVEWLLATLEAGTYYIRVEAGEDGATDYRIRFGLKDPVAISVAGARAEEGTDTSLDFEVRLDRGPGRLVPISVRYTTVDGTAVSGSDYTATAGTLTFEHGETSKTVSVPVLDDDHDEEEETLTLRLSGASEARISDSEATGTITNRDPLPRAMMARFGRASASHVVEQVEERLQAPREPGIRGRFAGRELRPDMERDTTPSAPSRLDGMVGAHTGGTGMQGPLSGATGPMGSRGGYSASSMGATPGPDGEPLGGGLLSMGLEGNLLTSSAFTLNRETRQGGILSFWSRSARSYFAGQEGALSLGGDARTTMFGADYAKGPLVAGLSLGHSRGRGEYGGVAGGRVASAVTGLYPWLGYKATDRITVWGVAGYGLGGMLLTPEGAPGLNADLSMAMAAAGTRGQLVAGGGGGFELAFKADALWVGTSTDGVDGPSGRLTATEAAVTRFRTGLEGSRDYALGNRLSLRPMVEVGLRHDGGDAETGAGMDIGGGLVVADAETGLAVDLRVRMLAAHQVEGFRERGVALSLSYNPTPSTPLGFMARVAPSWGGQATGGAEALWGRASMASMAPGGLAQGSRLDGEVGYGLPVGGRLVGTPRVGFSRSEYGRDYRVGYGLGVVDNESLRFELGVDAHRRESRMLGGTANGYLGRASLFW